MIGNLRLLGLDYLRHRLWERDSETICHFPRQVLRDVSEHGKGALTNGWNLHFGQFETKTADDVRLFTGV